MLGRRIRWKRECTIVHDRIGDCDRIRAVDIPAIRVDGRAGRVGVCVDVDVVVCHVLRLVDEVVLLQKSVSKSRCYWNRARAYPERRVDNADVLDHHIRGIANSQRNRTFKSGRRASSCAGILVGGLVVPPDLEILLTGAISEIKRRRTCPLPSIVPPPYRLMLLPLRNQKVEAF